jgi:AraC-like DNA-binding protein
MRPPRRSGVSFDPARPEFAPYGFTCVAWTPTPMSRPDRHNEIELNLINHGWVSYLFGGRKIRVAAGEIGVFWAAIPHQIVAYEPGTTYHVVTLPLAWFLNCKLPEGFVQALMRGQFACVPCRDRARQDIALFDGWTQDLRGNDPMTKKAVLLEMEARLLRLLVSNSLAQEAAEPTTGRMRAVSTSGLRKVEQMAGLIALRYTEHLMVQDVARAVKLHPNYAMNLFHKAFGMTLVNYITRHRVSHSQRLLITTEMKVIDIANASGFGSLSRFNDAFRQACGCSPRDYRREHAVAPWSRED